MTRHDREFREPRGRARGPQSPAPDDLVLFHLPPSGTTTRRATPRVNTPGEAFAPHGPGSNRVPLRGAGCRGTCVVAHALIDAKDLPLVLGYSWHIHNKGYASRVGSRRDGKPTILMHRQLLEVGAGDEQIEVDHLNGDRLDNRSANLRLTDRAGNAQNLHRFRPGTSEHRGVCWDRSRGLWRASAQVAGRQVLLGRFPDELDAHRAVSAWRREHMPWSARDHLAGTAA